VVDKVSEIISVPVDSVQETPTLVSSKINSEYLKGVILLEDEKKISKELEESSRLIILLDFHKMLKEKELLSIGEEVRKNSK
jgi:chemotaxis signal transduction protein